MRKPVVTRSKDKKRELFMAKGVSTSEAARLCGDASGSDSNQYRIVLNCQSDDNGVRGHRKVAVSFKAD